MTNKEVARIFNRLGKAMELHGENPFKIRSYGNDYNTIRRLPQEVTGLSRTELESIKGIGKNIADKIEELRDTGNMATLQKYLDKTPPGIVEMLSIKGLGAKKILAVWKDLGIESPGELMYACEENRLVELKGFGAKTQESIRAQLVYYLDSKGKYLYGHIADDLDQFLEEVGTRFQGARFSWTGDVLRQMPVVEKAVLQGTVPSDDFWSSISSIMDNPSEGELEYKGVQIHYQVASEAEFDEVLFEHSSSDEFAGAWRAAYTGADLKKDDQSLFESLGLEYIPPESRELPDAIRRAKEGQLQLIESEHIKGVVHNHSTYSDGANTLREMAEACIEGGYEYLVMSDHSKSAFYANGLNEDRVLQQMEEIDRLNKELQPFRIFKSIESDILYDGRLDYDDDLLGQFDLVIASVHSNLKMNEEKATERIVTAVSHPATRILGHPTGRLLLSRSGYPLDHMAVIDTCAEHNVVIELNANPYRLDLDWTWIPYALEKGVKISINPDAHSTEGIKHIRWGVSAARKALVRPEDCINTLNLSEFTKWVGNP